MLYYVKISHVIHQSTYTTLGFFAKSQLYKISMAHTWLIIVLHEISHIIKQSTYAILRFLVVILTNIKYINYFNKFLLIFIIGNRYKISTVIASKDNKSNINTK